MKVGLLKRYFQRREGPEEWSQLMAPSVYHRQILRVGHEAILAGHLGVKRIVDRIPRNYLWPGIFGDVTRF